MGMGNISERMSHSTKETSQTARKFEPVETFKFHGVFPEDTNNGLYFNNTYIPEEILVMILNYIDPKEVLNASLVCRKWCNIIKSDTFWSVMYSRVYHKKAKKLPWYVYYCFFTTNYFDQNLIKNGNGQNNYNYWKIILNYGDAFKIEDPPMGTEPLPPDIPEFNGHTSCFATSYYECNKLQEIPLENSRLMQLIFDKYRPHIYLSEWVAARFDCGCVYNLWCKLYPAVKLKRPLDECSSDSDDSDDPIHVEHTGLRIEQWSGNEWKKVELIVKDYPKGVRRLVFQHEGRDTQFWKGHYGSKMAGGVLKILFDTIEPTDR